MKTLILILALGASHGADAYFTNQRINTRAWTAPEVNPLERPFVHGTAWLAVAQGAKFGLTVGMYELARHKHHERLADAWMYSSTAAHTWGVAYTEANRHPVVKSR